MKKERDDGWYVFREKTTKSFEQFRADATRRLMQGLPGLVTTHRWQGRTCHVESLGAISNLSFQHGEVVCRLKISPWLVSFPRNKILSDVEATTREVAGTIVSENLDVFIVHGHDEARRNELRSLLEGMDLDPVIMQEEDDRGLTIIEKFEYYASTCSFAFILMTPDDRSSGGEDPESRWRARQNVIMELGWFMARLGRERVMILYTGELEIPSDILGVVYVRFEERIEEVDVVRRIRQRLKGVGFQV